MDQWANQACPKSTDLNQNSEINKIRFLFDIIIYEAI